MKYFPTFQYEICAKHPLSIPGMRGGITNFSCFELLVSQSISTLVL